MEKGTWATVQKAVDGDTLRLVNGKSVRLIGIDAPEIDHENQNHEPMAMEAWRFLSSMTNGKRVRLVQGQAHLDSYGRILAYVYDPEGRMLNFQMVEKGLAHVLYLYPDVQAFEKLLGAQRQALKNKQGKWRNFKWEQGPFVGNHRTKRFHRPDCSSAQTINSKHSVLLKNEREALWEGYAPCRQCLSFAKKKS